MITGLSYGLDGIDVSCLSSEAYNFSLHSQDVFYDAKNVEMAMLNDPDHTIKNCIFAFGYYSLFYDLSKTGTRRNCLDVYYPLFHDMHHCEDELPNEVKNSVEQAVKIPEFVTFYHEHFRKTGMSYYGPAIKPSDTVEEITKKGGWQKLSEEEKRQEADNLALHHNRHLGYLATYEENVEILKDTFKMLSDNGIRIHVMIMPFSKYYLNLIDPLYKKYMLSTFDQFDQEIKFLDFNDHDLFSDEDFLNADHLNEKGAVKLSEIIDGLL